MTNRPQITRIHTAQAQGRVKAQVSSVQSVLIRGPLEEGRSLSHHLELGGELARLRDRDVLILGSGNIVHNLLRLQGKTMISL